MSIISPLSLERENPVAMQPPSEVKLRSLKNSIPLPPISLFQEIAPVEVSFIIQKSKSPREVSVTSPL